MGENSQFWNNVHNVPLCTFIKHGLINNVHSVLLPNDLKTVENSQFWNKFHNVPLYTFIKHCLINNVHNVPPLITLKQVKTFNFGTMFTIFHFLLSLNMA